MATVCNASAAITDSGIARGGLSHPLQYKTPTGICTALILPSAFSTVRYHILTLILAFVFEQHHMLPLSESVWQCSSILM